MEEEYVIQPTVPSVNEKKKPVLYLANGQEVIIKKPLGFAHHSAVPPVHREKS